MAFLQRSRISVEKLSMIEKTSALWSASWSEAWIMKLNVDESDLDYRPAVHSETPSWIHLFLSSLYLEKHFNGWSPYAWWKLVVYKWEGKYQGVKQNYSRDRSPSYVAISTKNMWFEAKSIFRWTIPLILARKMKKSLCRRWGGGWWCCNRVLQ